MMRKNSFSDRRRIQGIVAAYLNQSDKKKHKREETTHKQQILILHYLGILDKYDISTVKKGLLFSKLLNKNDKNTEDHIRYVSGKIDKNEIKTRNNLEFVYKLFEELELTELAVLVKRDMDKFYNTEQE